MKTKFIHHIFRNEGFIKLDIKHRSIIKPFLDSGGIHHSSSSLASIFMWDAHEQYWWKIEDDMLLLVAAQDDPFLPLIPRGFGDPQKAIYSCQRLIAKMGGTSLNVDTLDEYERLNLPIFTVMESRSDYIYETQSIIDLKGGRYSTRRSTRNAFINSFPDIRTQHYDKSQLNACSELLAVWQHQSASQSDNHTAHRRSIELFCTRRLLGYTEG